MPYFTITSHTTAEEIKREYRTLVKELHPDRGGRSEDFQCLQTEFSAALEAIARRDRHRAQRQMAAGLIGLALQRLAENPNLVHHAIDRIQQGEAKQFLRESLPGIAYKIGLGLIDRLTKTPNEP